RGPVRPGRTLAPAPALTRWQARRMRLRQDRSLLLMTLPALALLLVFSYLPMVGVVTAFQQYTIYSDVFHQEWVGWFNFQHLFGDPNFWHAFENTLVLSA